MRYCSRYFKTSHVIVYLLTMLLSSFFLRYFKTSHVIVYHSVCGIVYSGKENFKTSHVIVYLEFRDRFLCKIHYFKTSHVIVYRSICRFLRIRLCNFKTSHVIVYQQQIYDYIAVEANFKTSHVIVYLRIFLCFFLIVVSFQNISCYCLSLLSCPTVPTFFNISKHLMLLFIGNCVPKKTTSFGFQNISCYCLSTIAYTEDSLKDNFKTSHVIVYPLFQVFYAVVLYISKHLMLLFI